MKQFALSLATTALATALTVSSPAGNKTELRGHPPSPTNGREKTIPLEHLGIEAQKQYSGQGISITPTDEGARLSVIFQRLDAEARSDGLWLQSTAACDSAIDARFCVRAIALVRCQDETSNLLLADIGQVHTTSNAVAFTRPYLIEEYSVSTDGLRQDFLVIERLDGNGDLDVTLEVKGAKVDMNGHGAKLTLENSGREIAYNRLRVTDANERVLSSRMNLGKDGNLHVLVDDHNAVYPVRIDPTFSDADWFSMGSLTGINGRVSAMAADSLGNLYIGGDFTIVGDLIANRIAKWNGNAWSALGTGMNNDIEALTVIGDDVYAGGRFTMAGGSVANFIAKWDGNAWNSLGLGMNNDVLALATSGNSLYAGGRFTAADDETALGVAKWNGSEWTSLGSGVNGLVFALVVSGTELYAGGYFTTAGGLSANHIAKWNGSNWSPLGSGLRGEYVIVNALAISGTTLYVGGAFSIAGESWAKNIAKWNNGFWSAMGALGDEDVGEVYTLLATGPDLYVGGWFNSVGGITANGFAKWNGSSWDTLSDGSAGPGSVGAFAMIGTEIYAAGSFSTAGEASSVNIARWNNDNWAKLVPESWSFAPAKNGDYDNNVRAVTVAGTDLYVGGNFRTVGGMTANNVAKWDGNAWTPLGIGVSGSVHCLASSGTDLYVGGSFYSAGGVVAHGIAKWDGNAWSALGSGVRSNDFTIVESLVVSGSILYAGGQFDLAGDVSAPNIANWDGYKWSPLGSGVNGEVCAMVASGSSLYVGGDFNMAGGVTAANVAKWDGRSWTRLDDGLNRTVRALAMSGTDLYAGGDFYRSGVVTSLSNIAKWDGYIWSPLGGLHGKVYSLVVSGTSLYAGGEFTTAYSEGGGEVRVNHIAKWHDNAWSTLGSGTDNHVYGLTVMGDSLYVGGKFRTAGDKVSLCVARARLDPISNSPEIAIAQPISKSLSNGDTKYFGSITLGTNNRLVFTVRNSGTAPLTGLAITKDGVESSDFIISGLGTSTLAPSTTTTFTVTFAPKATGSRSASMHIISNDADESSFNIVLSGTCVMPMPEIVVEHPDRTNLIDGEICSFGNVTLGYNMISTFTIKNAGTANLTGLSITKNGDNASDIIVGNLANTTLTPSSTTTFTVTFAPGAKGSRSATIHIASNDADESQFDIELVGIGVESSTADFDYSISELGVTITAYNGLGGMVAIPEMIDGIPVKSIGDHAFEDCTRLTGVNIPNSVTDLGYYAFKGCTGLTNVIIPNVVEIPDSAFKNCTTLHSVTIPAAKSIDGFDSFKGCTRLTTVIMPKVTSIGTSAFEDCISLHSITIPVVRSIESDAFLNCHALAEVYILGKAPGLYYDSFAGVAGNFAIYFASTGTRFTAPSWEGYPSVFVPNLNPEISVLHPVGSTMNDGGTEDYGSVLVGSRNELTITIKNTGSSSLFDLEVTKDGVNAADFTLGDLDSTVVAPGDSTTFTVSFRPGSTGSRTAAIHIASNDADENPFDLNLTGTGLVAPDIAVEQPVGEVLYDNSSSKSFGSVGIGTAAARTFTIRNTGGTSLTGLSITKDGIHQADFTVGSLGATTLAAGASTTFTVTFSPGVFGYRSAAIHIASNDPNENPFDIDLGGNGVDPNLNVAAGIDLPGAPITHGGQADWFGQVTSSHDGIDAAQSGYVADEQNSTFSLSATGPGTVSFWWKVSSESSCDYLRFYINGEAQVGKISGTVDWQQNTFSLAAGSHTLKWEYSKDSSISRGSDCGWVDQVVLPTSNTPQETWRQTHFSTPANTGTAADLADPDKDGVVNLLEYAFGLHPLQPSAGQMPKFQRSGSNLSVTFTQPKDVSGITYGAEWSPTMAVGTWLPLADTGTTPQHTFTVPMSEGQKFVRLRVVAP